VLKMIMARNSEQLMREKSLVNHVMKLWTKINTFFILKHKLLKFMKFDEIACAQVLGSMEHKKMFFCNGIHEEQVQEPPHWSSRLVHLIFCTTILHDR
jgi:hypothetical protein